MDILKKIRLILQNFPKTVSNDLNCVFKTTVHR